ncbi:MAG: hypothetical protein J6A23_15055, partial [Thermoguttaceae bacterium]|nr:hypothetical protein [Thermoguttaceae bacterium]
EDLLLCGDVDLLLCGDVDLLRRLNVQIRETKTETKQWLARISWSEGYLETIIQRTVAFFGE